ncbi:MAG: MotA/TolQ/ExbB proton channel family protein [Verrucomicrobiota bacterium]
MKQPSFPLTSFVPILLLFLFSSLGSAQEETVTPEQVQSKVDDDLKRSLSILSEMEQAITAQKVPLNKELNELESKVIELRQKFEEVDRELTTRNLAVTNLQKEVKVQKATEGYLSTLFDDYVRNFETQLHIAELSRYTDQIKAAANAPENPNLAPVDVFKAQAEVVDLSIERIKDLMGGSQFDGRALADGSIHEGKFVISGPIAVFASTDGAVAGLADQKLGSLEPNIIPLPDATLVPQVKNLATSGNGLLPFDPTQGDALKIEETNETISEHIAKGGFFVYPLIGIALIAWLLALYKFITFLGVRSARRKQVDEILAAIERRDKSAGLSIANKIGGPIGSMLVAAIDHINEPRELVEEVMYEKMLDAKLKLNSLLPFISVTAAAAPLLGLLGTVTGIIKTFKLITVYGAGDAKSLSSGISEALITTEIGLIVAIPSLMLYAFLSRKSAGILNTMEKLAIALLNRMSGTRSSASSSAAASVNPPLPQVTPPQPQPAG